MWSRDFLACSAFWSRVSDFPRGHSLTFVSECSLLCAPSFTAAVSQFRGCILQKLRLYATSLSHFEGSFKYSLLKMQTSFPSRWILQGQGYPQALKDAAAELWQHLFELSVWRKRCDLCICTKAQYNGFQSAFFRNIKTTGTDGITDL